MDKIDNKENIEVKTKRRGNPIWVKGMKSPNPKGNTHAKDIAGLVAALEDRAKREGYKNFDALVADRAAQHETVLIAVLKKVYPDLLEGKGFSEGIKTLIIERFIKSEPSRIKISG